MQGDCYSELIVATARFGGYVVRGTRARLQPEPVEFTGVLFAGSLEDCLAFIERSILKPVGDALQAR